MSKVCTLPCWICKIKIAALCVMNFVITGAYSQTDPTPFPSTPVFTLDVKSYETTGTIPFDKAFKLHLANVDTSIQKVRVYVYTGLEIGKGDLLDHFPVTERITNRGNITIPMLTKLAATGEYQFCVELIDSKGNIKSQVNYGFTLKTKIGDYIKLDLGLAYSPHINGVLAHTAVHFYFKPVNDDVDMKTVDGLCKNVFQRVSLFAGLSPVTLYSKTDQPIINATGVGNVIFGIGIRSPFYGKHMPFNKNFGWVFLQPLRINIGEVYFKQDNANPLITKNVDKLAWYVGISYDVKLAGILGPIGKLIKP